MKFHRMIFIYYLFSSAVLGTSLVLRWFKGNKSELFFFCFQEGGVKVMELDKVNRMVFFRVLPVKSPKI